MVLLSLVAAISSAEAQQLPGVTATEKVTVTLVKEGSGITVRKVSYLRSNNIVLVGNLFLPKNFDANAKYPAILCVHPAGSVKEQSAGLYAHRLAEQGFVTLAFDAAYAGESGGTPHWSEAPYERVEDIRYSTDYLVTLPFVDENRIGALGLCAGRRLCHRHGSDRPSYPRSRRSECCGYRCSKQRKLVAWPQRGGADKDSGRCVVAAYPGSTWRRTDESVHVPGTDCEDCALVP